MEEIWKDVVGWEGLYKVSNFGRVKSLERVTRFGDRYKTIKERIIKQALGKRGYYVVTFYEKGRRKTYTIHRLVAQAFIPNPENKPCIDHINTIRTDNRIENLRWVTSKENSNNAITLKRNSENTKKMWKDGFFDDRNNVHYRKVQQFDKKGNLINTYDSIVEASKITGINSSSISAVCLGTNPKRHTAGGFIWKHLGSHYMKE